MAPLFQLVRIQTHSNEHMIPDTPPDESRQIKLISRALPAIKQFVDEALVPLPRANDT